ncbi:MAG: glycosyltransferase [Bacteriovoracaceae bacterium]
MRKKILFISGLQIFPPESGGHLRSANLCRALVKNGYQVDLYSFTGRKKDYKQFKQSSREVIEEHLTEYTNRNPFLGLVQFLAYQLHLPPIWITLLTTLFIPRKLKKMMDIADETIIDFPFLYPVANYLNRQNKGFWLNTHNAEFELYKTDSLMANWVKKIEINSLALAKFVFFCSINDQAKFIPYLPKLAEKSFFVPNGVDTSRFHFKPEERLAIRRELNIDNDKKIFFFTGSQYAPNREAYEFLKSWYYQHKEDLVKLNSVILVVGSVSEDSINDPHFKVLGRVESMLPYFAVADFALNLVVKGSGSSVKMIEFLAAKIPVISTKFGARGLSLVDQKSCLFCEQSELLEVLKKATLLSPEEQRSIATLALEQNINQVDMTRALKNLPFSW